MLCIPCCAVMTYNQTPTAIRIIRLLRYISCTNVRRRLSISTSLRLVKSAAPRRSTCDGGCATAAMRHRLAAATTTAVAVTITQRRCDRRAVASLMTSRIIRSSCRCCFKARHRVTICPRPQRRLRYVTNDDIVKFSARRLSLAPHLARSEIVTSLMTSRLLLRLTPLSYLESPRRRAHLSARDVDVKSPPCRQRLTSSLRSAASVSAAAAAALAAVMTAMMSKSATSATTFNQDVAMRRVGVSLSVSAGRAYYPPPADGSALSVDRARPLAGVLRSTTAAASASASVRNVSQLLSAAPPPRKSQRRRRDRVVMTGYHPLIYRSAQLGTWRTKRGASIQWRTEETGTTSTATVRA